MNIIQITNSTKFKFEYEQEFNQILEAFAKVLNYKIDLKVDVLITNNRGIKKISKEYRNIDKETDVLSFPFDFNEFSEQLGFNFLGEIVLSYEKITKQANDLNHSEKREFCFLFAHGLVHLSGRDHKKNEDEEKTFNEIVYKIMDIVDIKRE